MDRIILHCDCNCFYASCELLSRPELRQLPVAVCGDPTERHGIILAKNEPAKRCGVKTAETIYKARQKCPGLILLPPHQQLYDEYSKKINAVYSEYTDLVEPFGIDESWLDVTGSLHLFGGEAKALADTLRNRIRQEFGLTISVGVSFNKVFAKLGSDYKKPDATTVISRENWREIVTPLPVGDLLFVGRSAQDLLGRYGVRTIGDLGKCSEEMLETLMGKMGLQLYRYANGLDNSPVRGEKDREPIKSVGNSTTFRRDLTRWDEVQSGISLLSDSVAMRLRRHGLYCGGVQVGIKNSRFQVFSRQTTLDHSTHLMREINDTALRTMAVLRPVKLVITNYPESQTETFEVENNPVHPEQGTHTVTFSREVWIEADDFLPEPIPKYKRLYPNGPECRLKGAYLITCTGCKQAADGSIEEIYATYDPDSRGGDPADGRKVKGATIHWVDCKTAVDAEVRLYENLFSDAQPDGPDKNFLDCLNPDSLTVLTGCKVESALVEEAKKYDAEGEGRTAKTAPGFQFMRVGYFCMDSRDCRADHLVFNRSVLLKDSFKPGK